MLLRSRLMTMMLIFAIVPMLIIATVGIVFAKNELRKMRFNTLETIAELKVKSIESFFTERENDVILMQKSGSIKKYLPVLSNPDHAKTSECGTARQKVGKTLNKIQQVSGYDNALLIDSGDNIVYEAKASSEETGGAIPRNLVTAAFESGRKGVAFGEIFDSGVPIAPYHILVSGPLKDDAGKFIGVVVFEVDMKTVFQIVLDRDGIGDTGETYIAEMDGNDARYISPLRYSPNAAFKKRLLFTKSSSTAIQKGFQMGNGSGEALDYRHKKVVAAWRQIPKLKWVLVAKMDMSEAFAQIGALGRLMFFCLGVALAGSWTIAALMSRFVSEPVLELEKGAKIVGSGNLDYKVSMDRKDEIGNLSRAFDQMTGSLKLVTSSRDELNREIEGRKLIEAQREKLIDELETRNRELDQFTYTVSHDLKSPIITVKGLLDMLGDYIAEGEKEEAQKAIHRISNSADKMLLLLTELLDLSRIGRIVNPPREIPMGEIVNDALEATSGRLSQRGVSVVVSPELPILCCDSVRMLQVFQNLIDNAVKFMGDQSDPRIEIGVERIEYETACYIRDNGSGIDATQQKKAFDLFERLNSSAEGTGIGLTIVKRIIEAHNGRIWMKSDGPGKGTTFWFILPVKKTA